jgi:hypothetical protein
MGKRGARGLHLAGGHFKNGMGAFTSIATGWPMASLRS